MLARSVLARLAADAPITPTHDLARSARLVHRRLLSRNGLLAPSAAARSRAYKAALLECRRSYATAATKATPKVKKDVKKAVAKKPGAKKAAPKKKKPAAKKAAPKKKAVPKKKKAVKPKPKPKRIKKVLTAEDKEKLSIKKYKEAALKAPTTLSQLSAWHTFAAEMLGKDAVGSKGASNALREAAAKYKNLEPAEKEHYNHLANERTAAKRAEYQAWIKTHTPEQIRQANIARNYLRRKATTPSRRRRYTPLQDDRLLTAPAPPYIRFSQERRKSGDLKSIPIGDASKLIGTEWNALSVSEKQKYVDEYLADVPKYKKKYEETYGHAPPSYTS
ncbi:hypothetical protein CC80DRAFT_597405 [Byssothecium circinans]|uniref:HMG box domain-containing protein n=1 Tax=Byssothecium circinans TaxID=147558 RepID=A0A6A5TH59_9PLEO|nr:hypothetical protein CC80DRAFT_597405 [Byssothecium circinans]